MTCEKPEDKKTITCEQINTLNELKEEMAGINIGLMSPAEMEEELSDYYDTLRILIDELTEEEYDKKEEPEELKGDTYTFIIDSTGGVMIKRNYNNKNECFIYTDQELLMEAITLSQEKEFNKKMSEE